VKFVLTNGNHCQQEGDRERVYSEGQIVEAGVDLAARWPEKFSRVNEAVDVEAVMQRAHERLLQLTTIELSAILEEMEVEVPEDANKAAMVAAIAKRRMPAGTAAN
jgi:hypothetical protein